MNAPVASEDWVADQTTVERARPAALPDRARAEWKGAVVLAFLVAPGVGCIALDLILAVADWMSAFPSFNLGVVLVMPLGLAFGAYPIALVFGIPAYLLVRDFRVDLVGSVFLGALVPMAPFLLASLLTGWSGLMRTSDIQFLAALGASGAAAGLAFWALTFRRLSRSPRVADASPRPVPPQPPAPARQLADPWRLTS